MLSKCQGKKDISKELRVRFVIFSNTIISESFFVSNNFVSEGKQGDARGTRELRRATSSYGPPPRGPCETPWNVSRQNCLPTVSRQFLTRNYPRRNCLLKYLPNCLSPTGGGFFASFKIAAVVRVIARQLRDQKLSRGNF